MKIATAAQMKEFDRRASDDFGVPGIVLMENAGREVFEAAREALGDPRGKRVTVVAGRGNNGGDGFVAARRLIEAGALVSVYLLGRPDEVRGDAKANLDILLDSGVPIPIVSAAEELSSSLCCCDLIVDAIFGTGLSGEVAGLASEVIRAVNASGIPVISVDVPSGLDADSGSVLGDCVRADRTVTFALPKIGLVTYPGAACVGRLIVADIGIPKCLYEEVGVELVEERMVADKLPTRPPDAHKGTFGHATIIAGSLGLTGAAALASEAALRVGAGLATLGCPAGLWNVMATKLTEVMTRGLPDKGNLSISSEAVAQALELVERGDSVILGCGLGTHPETVEFVRRFLRSASKPMVIDADGLNALAQSTGVLDGDHCELVLTPHPGEMARLLGTGTEAVQSNRMDVAKEAASRFRSVVVLKGARTVIADPSGRVFVNPTGGPGLATGGTGDVLAGAIGGLLAQGLSTLDAAICGAFVHGRAGDIAEERLGSAGMVAGDVLRTLPHALKGLLRAAA